MMLDQPLSILRSYPISSLVLLYTLYFCIRAIYRVTLHPLAKFPGPLSTAIGQWKEFYYEVIRPGHFSQQIDLMHEQYGPIIRVTPNEVHITDPDFYDLLYNFNSNIDRPPVAFENLQTSPSFELHKMRRRAIDPHFSKPAVLKLEDMISSNVNELCQRLHEARGGKAVDMALLTRCLTCEVISEYIFAKPYGFLTNPKASEAFFGSQRTIFKSIYLWRESYIANRLFQIMSTVPMLVLPSKFLQDTLAPFIHSVLDRVRAAKENSEKETQSAGHRIIFEELQKADVPASEKTEKYYLDTALLLITAGFETTAFTLEHAIFNLLSDPKMLQRLKEELMEACPNPDSLPGWTTLETLPYLTAVIQESLRMSIGVMSRLPRINTTQDLTYKQWVIPKGTKVSMSIKDIHYNPDIFPDPKRFSPDRWLQGEESERQKHYLCTFSKGARRCLGMNLAYAELYLTLAALFTRFNMELYQTTREDIEPVLDYFIPKAGTDNGVRVLVK